MAEIFKLTLLIKTNKKQPLLITLVKTHLPIWFYSPTCVSLASVRMILTMVAWIAKETAFSLPDSSKSEIKRHRTSRFRKTRSLTHALDAPKTIATMLARPPTTPGKPCRLWTPHVSWIFSLSVRHGYNCKKRKVYYFVRHTEVNDSRTILSMAPFAIISKTLLSQRIQIRWWQNYSCQFLADGFEGEWFQVLLLLTYWWYSESS